MGLRWRIVGILQVVVPIPEFSSFIDMVSTRVVTQHDVQYLPQDWIPRRAGQEGLEKFCSLLSSTVEKKCCLAKRCLTAMSLSM
jgi:hypothetical protein